jgi:hypothetical protein
VGPSSSKEYSRLHRFSAAVSGDGLASIKTTAAGPMKALFTPHATHANIATAATHHDGQAGALHDPTGRGLALAGAHDPEVGADHTVEGRQVVRCLSGPSVVLRELQLVADQRLGQVEGTAGVGGARRGHTT